MNIIISNKYQMLLANLDISDIQDNINGEFTVDDLITRYKNEWYLKMILDVTALKDYENINTIQKLSLGLDMNKVILLLDDSPKVNSPMYLSQLVSMGIYNFTKNVDNINYLINNPNTYKDVACYHQLSGAPQNESVISDTDNLIGQKIIGVKNITEHAGSTTLCYLLKKHLEKEYNVKAIEIDGNDFKYFNDKTLESVSSNNVSNFLESSKDYDVIVMDIPINGNAESYCNDVIYLIETGFIQLNRLVSNDIKIFEKLKGKKLIINRSSLSNSDISVFENESGSKVFFNLPSVSDKDDDIKFINNLLSALGFSRVGSSDSGRKGFSIFK